MEIHLWVCYLKVSLTISSYMVKFRERRERKPREGVGFAHRLLWMVQDWQVGTRPIILFRFTQWGGGGTQRELFHFYHSMVRSFTHSVFLSGSKT